MLSVIRRIKTMGVLELPMEKIATLFRHRNKLLEMEKAFFYYRYCNALFLAQKIGLFPALSEKPYGLQELSLKIEVPENTLKTLILILISQGFVEQENDRYKLSDFGVFFLKEDSIFASNYLIDLMATQAMDFPSTVKSVHDGSIPDHADVANPQTKESYQSFLTAVNSYLLWSGRELLQKIELGPVRTMIAGSPGVSFSSLVLKKYPDIKITYACLNHMAQEIPAFCQRFNIPEENIIDIRAHSGDPLEDDWGDQSYDLVFLTRKMIVDPSQKLGEKFAEKAFQVLSPGGKAIFWEIVYPEQGKMPISRAMEAMFDFCTSPAAIPRTETDYRDLLMGIGFKTVTIYACLEGQTTFIVAEK